jgi:Protein of unknown function (DUF2970)
MKEPVQLSTHGDGHENALLQGGGWFRTLKTVAWSFVGLRNGKEFDDDTQRINPIHLVIVGVGTASVFVVGLIFFVRWAVIAAK